MVFHDALHQRLAQSAFQGGDTLHGGRQLTMVAGKNHARGLADGNPAGGFEGLGSLIYKQGAEFHPLQQSVRGAHQRTGDDAGLAEEFALYADFKFRGALLQPFHLLVIFVVTAFPARPQFAECLAGSPQLRIVGMRLKPPFVGEGEHLVVDARGVADAEHGNTTVEQFLTDPIHRHVTLGTHQHLTLAHECLVDGLYECGGLARSRRSVHNHHVLGSQHAVHGLLLRLVQIGEREGREGERLRLDVARTRIEQVAQIGQPVAVGFHHAVERVEHHLVTGLVERQLHAHLFGVLEVAQRHIVGHDHHHAVAVHITHGARKREIFQFITGRPTEEGDGASEFKIMFNVLILRAVDFHGELVQRIVVGLAHLYRPPGIAALQFALHAHGSRLLTESLFLRRIFHLQQHFLLHQGLYGIYRLRHIHFRRSSRPQRLFACKDNIFIAKPLGLFSLIRNFVPRNQHKKKWQRIRFC